MNFMIPFYYSLKNTLKAHLLILLNYSRFIIITFLFKNRFILSPAIVIDFIYVRLAQRYRLNAIMSVLLRVLNKLHKKLNKGGSGFLRGFKIGVIGRMNRRDRCTYRWSKYGKLPLNLRYSNVVYEHRIVDLKYSSCSLKV
jgi:hypothetical protein